MSTPASERTKSRQRVHISVPKEERRWDIHYNVPLLTITDSQDDSWTVDVDTSVSKFCSNEKLVYTYNSHGISPLKIDYSLYYLYKSQRRLTTPLQHKLHHQKMKLFKEHQPDLGNLSHHLKGQVTQK